MLPGIGVLIFASQFHVMLDAKPIGNALKDIVSIPSSIPKAFARNCFAAREQREFRLQHLGIAGELRHEQGEIRDPVVDLLPREHLIDY